MSDEAAAALVATLGTSVEERILTVRGYRVMLDVDLAMAYGVTTKRLNEQVKRNAVRFPPDFAFRLTRGERTEVVVKCDHLRNLKFGHGFPRAFTEDGAIMVAMDHLRRHCLVNFFAAKQAIASARRPEGAVQLEPRATPWETG
jgi:hypothetical protein